MPDLTLLAAVRHDATHEQGPARFGITVTRQTANAVGRNRIRRRLREAIRVAAEHARPGHDHVLIARATVLAAPFSRLVEQIVAALDRAARSGNRPEPHSAGAARRHGNPA
jgi:ribonuclease P protein component